MANPTPVPVDNSSLGRKIVVPVLAGAVTGLVEVALSIGGVHLTDMQLAIGVPSMVTVLTALGDVFIPSRFLA
jgi:hypothetical protein